MRPYRLIFLLLLFPLTFHAQKSLTGLWTGTLTNDSVTARKDQSFEIALTQYREKVYGYSRATFIVHDTLYYIVKRVKGTVTGDVCEVRDDEIISNNFQGKIDKGVKVTITFRMNQQDSTWHLDGEWSTNKTRKFYAVSGKIELKDEPDLQKSKIFPHLEELNLAKDVPFYATAQKKEATAKQVATAPKKDPVTQTKPAESLAKTKKNTATSQDKTLTKNDSKKQEDLALNKTADQQNKQIEPTNKNKPATQQAQSGITISNPAEDKKAAVTAQAKNQTKTTATPPIVKPVEATPAAALVKDRATAPPQEVSFRSDSLELALYDNGEIDGDTVSVLLNGDIILAKQGLKTAAIKKTIYIAPGTNEVTLVLYAENLGKYPPNTGLLVVYDGEDRYQVRFSADLQQNASVVFRRKK